MAFVYLGGGVGMYDEALIDLVSKMSMVISSIDLIDQPLPIGLPFTTLCYKASALLLI
jgi:hypothetical protein